ALVGGDKLQRAGSRRRDRVVSDRRQARHVRERDETNAVVERQELLVVFARGRGRRLGLSAPRPRAGDLSLLLCLLPPGVVHPVEDGLAGNPEVAQRSEGELVPRGGRFRPGRVGGGVAADAVQPEAGQRVVKRVGVVVGDALALTWVAPEPAVL